MSVEAANVLAVETTVTCVGSRGPPSSLVDLIEQAKAIDSRLASWKTIIPLEWYPNSVPWQNIPQKIKDAGVYGDTCDVYPDTMVATIWNDWRWIRMRVLALLARYENDERLSAAIQGLADDFCASLPFTLGDRMEKAPMYASQNTYPSVEGQPLPKAHRQNAAAFGGWYLLTPLRETALMGKHLRKGQVEWIRSQMRRLANIYGVKY